RAVHPPEQGGPAGEEMAERCSETAHSGLASVPGDEGGPVEVPEGRRGDGGGVGAQRDLDEVVDAIRGRQAEWDRAQPEEDAPVTALPEPEAPNATDAPRGVVPDRSPRPDLAQRTGGDGYPVDLVVVAQRDRERLRRRVEPRGQATETDPERQDVLPRLIAEPHHAAHARDAFGTIPDGRRPGAFLDGLRDGGVAALGVACRHGGRVAAVDGLSVAEVGAPPAGRVLEHAGVVEGALPHLELRIAPDRAQGVEARAGRR